MIVLEYKNIEDYSCHLGPDEENWTDDIFYSAFLGNQIFKIENADFSGDYPVLGFARSLNRILFNINASDHDNVYVDPEHQNPDKLVFELEQSLVLVSRINRRNQTLICSARAPLDELQLCAREYLQRTIDYCT